MKTRAFWGLGLTLAVCAALAGCSSQQAKSAKASGPPPAVPVGVATVKQGDFNVYLTGLGSVDAFYTVSLKTRIDGQIMQVNFREGQDVKKGDLLIVIDPRPYEVALAQAKANLQKDEAQLTNAKAQYEERERRRHSTASGQEPQDVDVQAVRVAPGPAGFGSRNSDERGFELRSNADDGLSAVEPGEADLAGQRGSWRLRRSRRRRCRPASHADRPGCPRRRHQRRHRGSRRSDRRCRRSGSAGRVRRPRGP